MESTESHLHSLSLCRASSGNCFADFSQECLYFGVQDNVDIFVYVSVPDDDSNWNGTYELSVVRGESVCGKLAYVYEQIRARGSKNQTIISKVFWCKWKFDRACINES